jgi:hypothetical protein
MNKLAIPLSQQAGQLDVNLSLCSKVSQVARFVITSKLLGML